MAQLSDIDAGFSRILVACIDEKPLAQHFHKSRNVASLSRAENNARPDNEQSAAIPVGGLPSFMNQFASQLGAPVSRFRRRDGGFIFRCLCRAVGRNTAGEDQIWAV